MKTCNTNIYYSYQILPIVNMNKTLSVQHLSLWPIPWYHCSTCIDKLLKQNDHLFRYARVLISQTLRIRFTILFRKRYLWKIRKPIFGAVHSHYLRTILHKGLIHLTPYVIHTMYFYHEIVEYVGSKRVLSSYLFNHTIISDDNWMRPNVFLARTLRL